MEISNKDIYELIVHSSDDKTVLEMLSVNKKFSQDDAFKRVLQRRYPLLTSFRKEGETWKVLYLRMIYYIEKLKEDFDFPYINYKTFNPETQYKEYIGYKNKGLNNKIWGSGLRNAVRANRLDLIQHFLNKGTRNISVPYGIAVFFHNLKLMNFFESLRQDINYNDALVAAARANHLDLVKFLINEKGANDYNDALAKTSDWNIINYLINEKGANNFNQALANASYKENWRELADYFIEKGATNFNKALSMSALTDNIGMIKYLVDKGANNFNIVLEYVVSEGKINTVKYLLDEMKDRNIPIDFRIVKRDILRNKRENLEVIKYFIDKFPERLNLQLLTDLARENGKYELYKYLASKN